MNRYFFIVGYPRSRTAWLANLLTYGNTFCHHEALHNAPHARDLLSLMEVTPAEYVGDADPSLPLFAEGILREFRGARFVYIHRDKATARSSIREFLLRNPLKPTQVLSESHIEMSFDWYTWKLEALHSQLLAGGQQMIDVNYEDLSTVSSLNQLNAFCTGRDFESSAYDLTRVTMLIQMNVTADTTKYVENIGSPVTQQLIRKFTAEMRKELCLGE